MSTAFLPIDLDFTLPDEQDIINFCDSIEPSSEELGTQWHTYIIYSRLEQDSWKDINVCWHEIKNKTVYTGKKGKFYNGFDTTFPVFSKQLMQLPFKDISYIVLFRQRQEVGAHTDRIEGETLDDTLSIQNNDPRRLHLEPKRYNVLMTKFDYKSFYVCKDEKDTPIYPNITKEKPCFAFSLDEHAHGATYAGPDKIMAFVSGSLDEERHKEIIKRSTEVNKDKMIVF